MIQFIYFFVILVICIIAAIVGLGGGVFIRPIFDAIGYHDFNNIQFISSCAIIVLALVSTAQKMKDGTKIDMPLAISISIGAIIGGLVGDWVLSYLTNIMYSERTVQIAQTVSTIIALSLAIFLTVKKDLRCEVKSKLIPPLMGFILGMIAVYLGIGGGPLNVPIFMIFLGLTPKNAATYSLVLVFFTHSARIIRVGIASEFFTGYDIGILPFVIVAAAIGGLIGAKFSKLLSENTVKRMFVAILVVVILLNAFNGFLWITA